MAHITSGTKSVALPFSVWNAGITGVSGSLTKGSTLTITGRDFGTGPAFENCLYDSCDGTGTRTVNDAEIGAMTNVENSLSGSPYVSGARDSGNCIRGLVYDTAVNNTEVVRSAVSFTNSQKVYFSYWYKQMPDTFWPDANAGARNSFGTSGSSAKIAWLAYSDETYNFTANNDVIVASHANTSGWSIRGNDTGITIGTTAEMQDWWRFGEWMRITGYFEVDPTDPINNDGRCFVEFITASKAANAVTSLDVPFTMSKTNGNSSPNFWNGLSLFGWYEGGDLTSIGGTVEGDVDHRMDDIYLAWGDSCAATVEIGNNADYDLCTERTLCYADGAGWWSDSELKVKVEVGGLDFNSPLFLFIRHDNGHRKMSFPLSTLQGI